MIRLSGRAARSALLSRGLGTLVLVLGFTAGVEAQGVGVFGRITDASNGQAIAGAFVAVEGSNRSALSDSTGRFHIAGVPPGPHVLVVQHLAYASARIPVTVPSRGLLHRDIELATSALQLPGLIVTADPAARARNELGTASVIDRDAIANQTATSLAGILELVPGVELRPPGLSGVQQFGLRSVPPSFVTGVVSGGPSATDLASFGTLIILDGVPLSNNANLQTTGPRGESRVASSAGGGVDLRRIPASTIERVEVIRGVPSARYGDLTQGAVVVDTRAGAFDMEARALWDAASGGASVAGGRRAFGRQSLSATADLTRTRLAPGWRDDEAYRFAFQLGHRVAIGTGPARAGDAGGGAGTEFDVPRLLLDSRVDIYRVNEDSPENPTLPGQASWNREHGVRVSERARLALGSSSMIELTASFDNQRQRSMVQEPRTRAALPFTDRFDEGRSIGRYVIGRYLSRLELDGNVRDIYGRLELDHPARWWGANHELRLGTELRRSWNTGAGYQFDIEFPPQVTFNGVQGFDRPRRFDAIPPVATSAVYADERLVQVLPWGVSLDVQAGVRVDVLHEGTSWFSAAHDAVVQPRLNVQIAPLSWLRLRGGIGRTAKQPTLASLYPAPQYFDVVNVNWYANDPAERLAVLTTFIRDPRNPDLGFSVGRKREAGIELASADADASLSVVAFSDRTTGAVGFRQTPGFLTREHFELSDSTLGTGRPPEIIEPASRTDTVPILRDVPSNNLRLESSGWELTARLPELKPLRLRLEAQVALIDSRLFKDGLDFGLRFSEFQVDARIPRSPFWEDVANTGKRGLATYRLVHHQPELGLVITGTVQHIFKEERQNLGGIDTLAFAGYVGRDGRLVPIPAAERGLPENADLRIRRQNTTTTRTVLQPDWFLSVQASLRLPLDGRLSFYAFNALDRKGRLGSGGRSSRGFPGARFGLEATLPLASLW